MWCAWVWVGVGVCAWVWVGVVGGCGGWVWWVGVVGGCGGWVWCGCAGGAGRRREGTKNKFGNLGQQFSLILVIFFTMFSMFLHIHFHVNPMCFSFISYFSYFHWKGRHCPAFPPTPPPQRPQKT